MNIEQIVQRFKFLGLTEYQARVLYALLKNKTATISTIAKDSEVPTTRIYDVVKQLINMDLVMQVSDKPKMYKIRDIDYVLDTLIAKKQEAFEQVKKDLNNLKELFKTNTFEETSRIIKIEREIDLIKAINEEIKGANKSIIGFLGDEIKHPLLRDSLRSKSKDVEVKLLVRPDLKNVVPEGIEAKVVDHGISAFIIDDKKVLLYLNSKEENTHNLTIHNNHHGLKDLIKSYFDMKWQS